MTVNMDGPPDGGWGWLCVVGKLYCYFITLGLTSAFGVVYVELIEYFNSTREEAAWIGSLSFGLTLLICPLSSVLTSRFGLRKTSSIGTVIAFSGCLISCFANGIPYLYVSYGVIMGCGFGILFIPSVLIVLQYFKARLGLANAIGSAGNGIGTLVLPPLYTYLLGEYGWRGTLMLQSGVILNGLVCAFIFIPPPYLKASGNITASEAKKVHFLKNIKTFICNPCTLLYLTGLMIETLGYSIPFVHLPDMALQIGHDKYQAATLVSIMGFAGIVGRILFGLLSDCQCFDIMLFQGISLLICGAATVVCPQLTEFYALVVYSIIYGIFIGTFISFIPLVALKLVGIDHTGDFMGLLLCLPGIVNVISSPVAGWLFDTTQTYSASFYVASGVFAIGGVLIIIVWGLHRWINRKNGDNDNHT